MSSLRRFACSSVAFFLLCAVASAQRLRINHPLEATGDVYGFDVSPDGAYAVYTARVTPPGPLSLYSVKLPHGPSKLLEPELATFTFQIGSGRVVYTRYAPSEAVCSAPLDDSADPLVLYGDSDGYLLSPDGYWIVIHDPPGLWVVPIDGSAAPALLHGEWTPYCRFTPDGAHLLFVIQNGGPAGEGLLYSARLDRSTPPVLLNAGATEANTTYVVGSPDGWVVYRDGHYGNFGRRIFGVPIDGSAPPVQLNPVLPVGQSFGLSFTPDGSRLVYSVDQNELHMQELFSVPVGGGEPPVQINAPFAPGETIYSFRVTHDGTEVVYDTSVLPPPASEGSVYAVPVQGGSAHQLNLPGQPARRFELSPDGVHVAYTSAGHLFLASLEPGTDVVPLTEPFGVDPGLSEFVFDSAGERITYLRTYVEDPWTFCHVHAVGTSGVFPPAQLDSPGVAGSGTLYQVPGGGLRKRFALGDSLAVFIADLERDDVYELWGSWLEKRKFDRR